MREGNNPNEYRDMTKYQIVTEDIRHSKNQQWLTVYYTLSINAALITYYKMIGNYESFIFVISSVSVIFGTFIISAYEKNIMGSRTETEKRVKPLYFGKKSDNHPDWIEFILLVVFILTFITANVLLCLITEIDWLFTFIPATASFLIFFIFIIFSKDKYNKYISEEQTD